MTRYEERLRSLKLSPSELATMAEAESEELRVQGSNPNAAKDHSIKLNILRKLRDEKMTPCLPIFDAYLEP